MKSVIFCKAIFAFLLLNFLLDEGLAGNTTNLEGIFSSIYEAAKSRGFQNNNSEVINELRNTSSSPYFLMFPYSLQLYQFFSIFFSTANVEDIIPISRTSTNTAIDYEEKLRRLYMQWCPRFCSRGENRSFVLKACFSFNDNRVKVLCNICRNRCHLGLSSIFN